MGTGTDAAIEASDLTLVRGDLMAAADAIRLSRRTLRTIKANLQAFFLVNQAVIMIGYWWAGLLTTEVWRYAAVFLVPATLGLLLGMALFARVDQARFRRIVFAILFASGLLLVVRG